MNKPSALAISLLSLCVAGVSALAFFQWRELKVLRETVKTDEARLKSNSVGRTDLVGKLQAAQGKLRELDAEIAAAAETRQVRTSSALADVRHLKTLSDLTKEWLALVNDPEVATRLTTKFKSQANSKYAAVISKLGLSDEQAQKLIDLVVDKKLVPTDVAVAEVQTNSGQIVDAGALAGAVAAERAKIDTQIQGLLGDSAFNDFRSYDMQIGQSGVVTDLQRELAGTTTPLSDQQAAMLQQTLQANNIGHISEKVVGEAQSFLGPEQIQALQNLQLREMGGTLQHVPH